MSTAANGTHFERFAATRRGLLVPLAVLLSWEVVTRFHWVNSQLLVSPQAVARALRTAVREGELGTQLLASLRRDALGFLLGSFAGVIVGSALGLSRTVERLFGSTFHAAKQIAIFAWLPLISVWFGTEEPAKVVFIALSAFYPVVVNTYEGVRSVSREYLEVARVFRFSRWQALRKVIGPGALPSLFAGLHLGLIYAWLGTLGAEYLLAAGPGIGYLMIDGREQLAMEKVLLGVAIVGLVGFALNTLASTLENAVLRWRVPNS
jgi:sulfonate transport system permease protein